MQFTKGSISLPVIQDETYPALAKRMIAAVLQAVPSLSLKSINTETEQIYSVTLSYRGLDISIKNSYNRIFCKIGNDSETSDYGCDPSYIYNMYYMYNEAGIFSFKFICPNKSGARNYYGWGISGIPIELTMSNGLQKELLAVSFGYQRIGAATFITNSMASAGTDLYDPDTGNQYTSTLTTPSYPYEGQIGKTVVIPRNLSSTYGEISSYEVSGGGKFYIIYPGCYFNLDDNHCGLLPIMVGSTRYIATSNNGVWMEA